MKSRHLHHWPRTRFSRNHLARIARAAMLIAGIGAAPSALQAAIDTSIDFESIGQVRPPGGGSGPSWDVIVGGPQSCWLHCWTEHQYSTIHDECTGHSRVLDCSKRVCELWGIVGPGEECEQTEEYLEPESCFYCLDHPECCGIDVPGGGIDDDWWEITHEALAEYVDDSMHFQYVEYLATRYALPELGLTASRVGDSDGSSMAIFTRPAEVPPLEPAVLELSVTRLNLLLEVSQEQQSVGATSKTLTIESPQLGMLLELTIDQPEGAMATISGDIPAGAFQLSPGRAELAGYQHPVIEVPIPPGMMEVQLEVRYVASASEDYDRNGNDYPDPQDIAEGFSQDSNSNGIPDEVEAFGLLHHALGQARLEAGPASALSVSSIGSSGQDGVAVDFEPASAYHAEFGELPAVGQVPVGSELRSVVRGTYDGVADTTIGAIRARKTSPGGRASLLANFESIGATFSVYAFDGDVMVHSASGYSDASIPFASTDHWPSGIDWDKAIGRGWTDPPEGGGQFTFAEGTQLVFGGGPAVLADRLVVAISNSIRGPGGWSDGDITGVANQAARFGAISIVDESVVTLDQGCSSTAACPDADVNCDNVTDGFDVAIIRNGANWLRAVVDAADTRTDVNGDGMVDGFDIAVIRGGVCWLQ